jgi:hypothetical protein
MLANIVLLLSNRVQLLASVDVDARYRLSEHGRAVIIITQEKLTSWVCPASRILVPYF